MKLCFSIFQMPSNLTNEMNFPFKKQKESSLELCLISMEWVALVQPCISPKSTGQKVLRISTDSWRHFLNSNHDI